MKTKFFMHATFAAPPSFQRAGSWHKGVFLLLFSFLSIKVHSQGFPASDDEFVGPFTSWINAKTQYGATGDGITDETAALQAAINAVGNAGSTSMVVYLPAGTYKITGSLTVTGKMNISIIGADPATTKIVWAGASSGTMLKINGVAYSRFNRITFDGSSSAAIAVDQSWDGGQPYFDTGNEFADDEFKNTGIGIRGGHLGYGFAETAIMRCKFTNNTTAGVTLGNFNALDVWVWHSIFENCAVGITNNNTVNSAGNFKVYNSIFRNSTTSDIIIGNTGEFACRDNTSTNSQMFLKATFKTYPAHITIQSNTIIDPVASKAIDIQDQGPVMLLDNIIRSRAGATAPVVSHTPFPSGDFFSMGNTFTVANAITATGRKITYDNAVVTAASLSGLAEQTLPGTQPSMGRTVLEVPAGSNAAAIQSIIDQAALLVGTRPVVHFPYGTYNINTTLNIPANSDMQITGDGHGDLYPTWLWWTGNSTGQVFSIAGPSKVTFRDISINANNLVPAIYMTNVDQVGARFFMHELEANLNTNGIYVNGLDNMTVLAYNSRISQTTGKAVKIVGGALASNGLPQQGRTILYGGLEWENNLSHEVTNGGNLLVRDYWYESSNNGGYVSLTGKATCTVEGGSVASPRATAVPQVSISGLTGSATFVNNFFQDRVAISGSGSNAKLLGLGTVFGDNTLPVSPSTTTYIDNTTSPAANVQSFNCRSNNNPNLATPRSGSFAVDDIGTADSTSIANMLAHMRTVHAKVLTSLANGISDIRFYRVWIYKGTTAIDLEGSGSALPVKFISSNSSCSNGNVRLNWAVQQDNSPGHFEIERNDNGSWTVIGSLGWAGSGSPVRSYDFIDGAGNSNSLYRILYKADNGSNSLSNILHTSCSVTTEELRVYPNPLRNEAILTLVSTTKTDVLITVSDSKGVSVKQLKIKLLEGNNPVQLDLSGLANGVYLVKAAWNGHTGLRKVVKTGG